MSGWRLARDEKGEKHTSLRTRRVYLLMTTRACPRLISQGDSTSKVIIARPNRVRCWTIRNLYWLNRALSWEHLHSRHHPSTYAFCPLLLPRCQSQYHWKSKNTYVMCAVKSSPACFLDCLEISLARSFPFNSYIGHSPLFFHKIVRIERLPVRATILVSYVPRGRVSGFIAVGGGRRELPRSLRLIQNGRREAKRSISTILQKNRGLWTVYLSVPKTNQ